MKDPWVAIRPQLCQGISVLDNYELPRLGVAGTGRPSGPLQDASHQRFRDRVGLEVSYSAAAADTLVDFHEVTSSIPAPDRRLFGEG